MRVRKNTQSSARNDIVRQLHFKLTFHRSPTQINRYHACRGTTRYRFLEDIRGHSICLHHTLTASVADSISARVQRSKLWPRTVREPNDDLLPVVGNHQG